MIAAPADDPLWPEFKLLWGDLKKAGESFLVAGGYGLFLKQHWLIARNETPTIVPVAQWLDPAPRVTKDVDIVIGLDLIASEESQSRMSRALKIHQYEVVDPRWQFRKVLDENRQVTVDFHSCPPTEGDQNLDSDKLRVKHKPSLGDEGIHGRLNAEAIGGGLHPFGFEIENIAITVPNPVTWCVMKLVAMEDCWRRSDEDTREEVFRNFHRDQAIKHARDVCRAVALTTESERDGCTNVIHGIRQSLKYQSAAKICAEYFAENGRATQVSRSMWNNNDLPLVCQIIREWFQPPK